MVELITSAVYHFRTANNNFHNKKKTKHLHSNHEKILPRFTEQMEGVEFHSYPVKIDVQNTIDCNADSLHKCDMGDPLTLIGCKELLVECHHFDDNVKVHCKNKVESVIPKNSHPNEGYALSITSKIKEKCNPYHGELSLVTLDADSHEYMLICTCFNPGYIGNEHLLGNCSTVFICRGQVDDINKPVKDIKCMCNDTQIADNYENDGLPYCRELTVKDANQRGVDWTNLVPWDGSRDTLDIKYFRKDIASTLRVKKLLNPCTTSLHDTSISIPGASFDLVSGKCNTYNYGFPVSNGLLDSETRKMFYKKQKFNADLSEGSDEKNNLPIDALVYTNQYELVRFSDNIDGKRNIVGLVVNGLGDSFKEYKDKPLALAVPYGISFGGQASISMAPKPGDFVGAVCDASPRWWINCWYKQGYYRDLYNMPRSTYEALDPLSPAMLFNSANKYKWETVNLLNTKASRQTFYHGYQIDLDILQRLPKEQLYGIQFYKQSDKNGYHHNGWTVFRDDHDWAVHKSSRLAKANEET